MLVACFVATSCAWQQSSDPVVYTNGEQLNGEWEKSEAAIAVFRGVPFAKPPVGDLRWRAPVPNKPRTGPQDATEFAPACMQTTYMTDWYASVAERFGYGPESVGRPNGVSEDCLYLNVWTPQLDTNASLPVMVWVHGGSNKGGWSYEPNYIGTNLAAKGVIVVSITYRLGAFGFFSHPLLNNSNNEPVANFGWLDTIEAFRWVKRNIQAFGGDPDNITAFGESSGAGNISNWIATDFQEQLYNKAILQSSAGSLVARRSLSDEQLVGQRLIDATKEQAQTVDELRQIPASSILTTTQTAMEGHYFDVVLDYLTFPVSPLESLTIEDEFKVDLLIGTNAHEWYMYIDESANQSDLESSIETHAPENKREMLAAVKNETDILRAMDRIETAANMLCPSRFVASRVTELGGRGWMYYFDRVRQGVGGQKMGAYHGAEIPYVFNMHDEWLPTVSTDHELTENIMDFWVQFARNGNPNVPGQPDWPVYKQEKPQVMRLGETIEVITAPDLQLCELLAPSR